jgi:hypothetical protein
MDINSFSLKALGFEKKEPHETSYVELESFV